MDDMKLDIIFEDEDIIVVDKPAGITVNKSDTTKHEDTLQDWVEGYLKVSKEKKASNVLRGEENKTFDIFLSRAGIVHRIDKETSGILLVAKTAEAFVTLQKQFKDRTVEKKYIALVHGIINPETGKINAPVGRLPWNRIRFGVVAEGREALTYYSVIKKVLYPDSSVKEMLSLVELFPKTGRTHQIRVHLKHIGHPIFGDLLYAGRKTSRDDRKYLGRLFLHAVSLSFLHPRTEKKVVFQSPLPFDLQTFFYSLKL